MKASTRAWAMAAALTLSGCTRLGGPAATPTLSSENVMRTAETIAQQTRDAATPTPSEVPTTPTPTAPLVSDTPIPTATSASPIVTCNYNVAVRSGPGVQYDQVDLFLQGQTADVIGKFGTSPNETWYSIHRIGAGKDGWVWSGAVTFGGNSGRVPELPAPPTQTLTPGPTHPPTPSATPGTPSPTATH